MPIRFTSYYSTGFPTNAENPLVTDGVLGRRWRHSFETALSFDTTNGVIYLIWGSCSIAAFYGTPDSTNRYPDFSPNNGDVLSVAAHGYRLRKRDQTLWDFNATGQLTAIQDKSGNQLTLDYANSRLNKVSLQGGADSIRFEYDTNNKLKSVAGSNGVTLTLSVQSNTLSSITIPGIGTRKYAYTGGAKALMQKVTDQWGNLLVFNAYDSQDRVQMQYDGPGYATSPKYGTSFVYGNTTWLGAAVNSTVVTRPDGDVTTWYSDPASALILYQSVDLEKNSGGETLQQVVTTTYTGFQQPLTIKTYRGPKSSWTANKGATLTYAYDNAMNVVSVSDGAGRTQLSTWDARNNLLSHTDIWGNTTHYTYNPDNSLHTITSAIGEQSVLTYTPKPSGLSFNGLAVSITNTTGNEIALKYDNSTGLRTETTDAWGNKQILSYDASGRQKSEEIKSAGGVRLRLITTGHDNLGRPVLHRVQMDAQTVAQAFDTTWVYDTPTTNTIVETDPNGKTLTTTLNTMRQPIKKVWDAYDGVVVAESTGYTKNGLLGSIAQGSNSVETIAYNGLDEVISVTDPLGNIETFYTQQVYGSGDVPSATQQVRTPPTLSMPDMTTGQLADYVYVEEQTFDLSGQPIGTLLSFGKSGSGSPDWQKSEVVSYALSPMTKGAATWQQLTTKQVTHALVPSGSTITQSQAADGIYRPVSFTDALGKVTAISYGQAAAPGTPGVQVKTQTTTPPAGAATETFLDDANQVIAATAGATADETAQWFQYDALNRVTTGRVGDTLANVVAGTLTAHGAAQTQYTYSIDTTGTPRMQIDVMRATTDTTATPVVEQSLFYDGKSQLIEEMIVPAASFKTDFAPWGAVGKRTNPDGSDITYAFDTAGALTKITPKTGSAIEHTLDDAGNRLTTSLGTTLQITRGFDAWNRLNSRKTGTNTVTNSQWPNGLMRTLSLPGGDTIKYELDGLGYWASITDWSSRTTTYDYYATGALKTQTSANGTVASFTYNESGAPTGYSLTGGDGSVLAALTYQPDTLNRPGGAAGIWPQPLISPDTSTTFTYSGDVATKWNNTALASDANGAMTQLPSDTAGKTIAASYNAWGQIASVGDVAWTYDADALCASRTEGADTTDYVSVPNGFDAAQVNMGSNSRISLQTTRQVSNVNSNVILPNYGHSGGAGKGAASELASNVPMQLDWLAQATQGATTTRYVHGHGPILGDAGNSGSSHFHFDPFGNLGAKTDSTGAASQTFIFAPWGGPRTSDQPTTLFGFAGQFGAQTSANGVTTMRNRAFSPDLMRFTSKDLLVVR